MWGGEEKSRKQEREIEREVIIPIELSLDYKVLLHSPEYSVLTLIVCYPSCETHSRMHEIRTIYQYTLV